MKVKFYLILLMTSILLTGCWSYRYNEAPNSDNNKAIQEDSNTEQNRIMYTLSQGK